MILSRRSCLRGAGALATLAGFGGAQLARAQSASPKLPSTMVWSSYDVGSAGYVQASAIADAFGKRYGTRIRLQPSGTSIGRVQPLLSGKSSIGWLATEVFFATEGMYEFCTPRFGPQDLRTLAGVPTGFTIAATAVSGIKKVEDLKGKRFAIAKANSSITIKSEPILAFGGLTWDDVQLVEVPSYNASLRALIEGRADAAGVAPTAAGLYELEASPNGIAWFQMPPENEEGWARVREVVPFVEPFQETIGAGLSAENPVWMMGYRYPMLTMRADADPNLAYATLRALDGAYDTFKDTAPVMKRWAINQSGTPPMDAPLHDGAIRYLQEIGQWGAEQQAWQDKIVKRHAALRQAWKGFITMDTVKAADTEKRLALWQAERKGVLDSL